MIGEKGSRGPRGHDFSIAFTARHKGKVHFGQMHCGEGVVEDGGRSRVFVSRAAPQPMMYIWINKGYMNAQFVSVRRGER